jgi:hypothetical protein
MTDSKNKERTKRYRQKLKENPERFKTAKEKQKIRNQRYWEKIKNNPELLEKRKY